MVDTIGPLAITALRAALPIGPESQRLSQTLPVPEAKPPGSSQVQAQDLAQGLFQRALQSAASSPLADPPSGSLGLLQEATASLLASLVPAPAGASTPEAPLLGTGASSPPATPPMLGDLPAVQDAVATSAGPDFALQTALRFGAGVGAQAAQALPAAELGTGLVRDATAVLRLGSLQPHAGGPGPEAFARPQPPIPRPLRIYPTAPVPEGPAGVDLLA